MKNSAMALMGAVLLVLTVFVCDSMGPRVDEVIKQIVRSVNDALYQMEGDPNLLAARCYRDGDKEGVILEYVFAQEVDKSQMDSMAVIRERLTDKLKHSVDFDRLSSLGIYFVVVYKNPDKTEILRVAIGAEDVE